MKPLTPSPITFDAENHKYFLGTLQLQGITNVIKTKLFPDEYKDVPEDVLKRAAERGTRIHAALELFDTCGVLTDDCPELASYIERRDARGYLTTHVASEYLVTDHKQYASAIDKVFADPYDDSAAILADVKTTYKLNEEYVSWQLSVYAEWFEEMNPGTRVSHLYAIWVRDKKIRIVEVARKSKEQVTELLYGTDPMTPATTSGTLPAIAAMEDEIARIKAEADAAAARLEELKKGLLAVMQKANARTYDSDNIRVTRKQESTRTKFDAKRLKEDHPEIYDEYCTTYTQGETILLTIKK